MNSSRFSHIHIDPIGGLAGNMFLAAGIDANITTTDRLGEAFSKLDLDAPPVITRRVTRGGITGTHLTFDLDDLEDAAHRHLTDIMALLDRSKLPAGVRNRAQAMFQALGEVEGAIHDIPVENVHFHEVGALDSILDIVGAATIIEDTDTSWSVGPVSTGQGTVQTQHGTLPLPAPATAKLLEQFELAARDVSEELITPTGALILHTLRSEGRLGTHRAGVLHASGYGAGTRELDTLANVTRLLVYERASADSSSPATDQIGLLACEVDDMSPELLSDVEDVLLANGAFDVSREPVLMKKGRQGTHLRVLCPPDQTKRVARLILRHTTTFGVRCETVQRYKLTRRTETIETPYGSVQVKLGQLGSERLRAVPEFEDCKHLAREHGIPTQEVYETAQELARKKYLGT